MSDDVRGTWGKYAPAFAAEGAAAEDRDSIRRLVEMCALKPGSLVLDVATGAGYTAFAFARAGMNVIPSDPTFEMLAATKSGWTERELPEGARCVEAWAERLPFRDASLDAVVAHRAPHQFDDVDAWARDALRVLKPGGVFGLSDQSPPDGFEDWHNDFERMRDPTHEQARSPHEWKAVAEGAGFTVTGVDVVYQVHDVQDWLDRVDADDERQAACRKMLDEIPDEIAGIYLPQVIDGRLKMRTPQCVLVASI